MDRLGVPWAYEVPVIVDGKQVRYLPDFLIDTDMATTDTDEGKVYLHLGASGSRWVEVKPQSFIYQLRDHLGVPERTNDAVAVTAEELRDARVEELWKPKRLAELTGRAVLVVGEVDRVRTLSVTMTPDAVVFRTDHPFVNTRAVVAEMRKRRERREWRETYERERLEREARWQQMAEQQEAERQERRRFRLRMLGATSFAGWTKKQASFAGSCEVCETYVESSDLWVYYRPSQPYHVICKACDNAARAVRT